MPTCSGGNSVCSHPDPRGEEGLRVRAGRQSADVDHLKFAPAEGVEVPGEAEGIAHAGAEMDPVAADGGQPLDLTGLPVEQVHDGARHAEQIAQPPEDRLRDRHRRGLGDDGAVDLVQDLEAPGLLGHRLLRLRVAERDGRLVGEGLQEGNLVVGEGPRGRAAHR
jgi:hypothetical protein